MVPSDSHESGIWHGGTGDQGVEFSSASERETYGGLARRIHEVPSKDARRLLLEARDEIARMCLRHADFPAPQGDMSVAHVSVGIGLDPKERRPSGLYPIRIETSSPRFLEWACRRFPERAFKGQPVRVVSVPCPIQQDEMVHGSRSGTAKHPGYAVIAMGSPISAKDDKTHFGSLGCFVRGTSGMMGDLRAITARHVVDRIADPLLGAVCVCPPEALCRPSTAPLRFGAVMGPHVPHRDACLVSIDDHLHSGAKNSLSYGRRSRMLRSPVALPTMRMKVGKLGAGSGYRSGKVVQIGQSLMARSRNGDQVQFNDLFLVRGSWTRRFSLPGDSGSIVFDSASRQPVGMIIAGTTGTTTLCIELEPLFKDLGVELQ